MTNSQGGVITFPADGVFGVGRLATIVKGLTASGRIGSWHVGHWIDLRHKVIRIQFDTRADGEVAKGWNEAHVPAGAVSNARLATSIMP